tara:strand:- start:248 stop:580 length:333 start_codon:yes stop_codon:yes gene_type:complete
MKITKRQLIRIIKEEKAKIQKQLKESVTDMRHYEDMIEGAAFDISERFMLDMGDMYDENPEMFEGRPKAEWNRETMAASSELDRRISLEVATAVREIEAKLNNGDYAGQK